MLYDSVDDLRYPFPDFGSSRVLLSMSDGWGAATYSNRHPEFCLLRKDLTPVGYRDARIIDHQK
jgi:hypothetical protein